MCVHLGICVYWCSHACTCESLFHWCACNVLLHMCSLCLVYIGVCVCQLGAMCELSVKSNSVTPVLLTDSSARALLGAHCYEKRRTRTAKPGLETQRSLTVLALCMCEWAVFTQPTMFGREWWALGVVQLLSGLRGGE